MKRKFDARRIFTAFFAGTFAVVGSLVAIETPAMAAPGDASTIDYALSFNGTSDQLEAAEGTQYQSRATYTVETWINPTNVSCVGSNCPVASHDGDWWFGIQGGTYQYLIYHTATNNHTGFIDTGIAAKANTWTHLALVRDGAAVRFFVNGTEVKSTTLPGAGRSTYSGYPIKVGRHYNSEYFTGLIDELKIWSTVRSSASIATDMHNYQTSASTTAGLLAYFDFNEGGSNTTINNRVGTGANLSFVNANPAVNYVDIKSSSKVNGKTVVSFPRSYLVPAGGWSVPAGATVADALAVAGGGGGGSRHAGGGGSGEVGQYSRMTLTQNQALRIKVGAGGKGFDSVINNTDNNNGTDGQSTVFGPDEFLGGGGGKASNGSPRNGGSGGGGAGCNPGGIAVAGSGTSTSPVLTRFSSSGASGGTDVACGFTAAHYYGGGGGGATGAGLAGSPAGPGAGGQGFSSAITGTAKCYAAGGGGGSTNSSVGAAGACTNGAATTATPGTFNTAALAASPNSGSGGGGGGYANSDDLPGGNGGSGIVVIAYASSTEDTAFDFVGGANGQYRATNKQLVPSRASNTFEMWFKADGLNSSGFNDIFRQQASASNYQAFALGVYKGQLQLIYSIRDTDQATVNSFNESNSLMKVKAGEWYHVAVSTVYSVSGANSTYNFRIYVNGALAYSTDRTEATSSLSTLGSAEMTIGNLPGATGTRAWNGKIDQIKVWNGALTQAEIAKSMHAYGSTSVVETSGASLRAHYDFNSPDTSSLPDVAGNGYDLNLTAGATAPAVYSVAQTSTVANSTLVKIDRTYLTTWGGWISPLATSSASILAVGAGGGAGKGTSGSSQPGGSGGGGGVVSQTGQTLSSSAVYPVIIGQAGLGATTISNNATTRNGQSTRFNSATALGGGGGGSYGYPGAGSGPQDASIATGGGGGGAAGSSCADLGFAGGIVSGALNGSAGCYGWGGGGGGAGSAGIQGSNSSNYGMPGSGIASAISGTSVTYGKGGHAGYFADKPATVANSGTGGHIQYGTGAPAPGEGLAGQAGVVIVSVRTANTITFDANGGTGSISPQYINIGSSANLTTNTLTNGSNTFAGWATSNAGAVVYTDGGSITPSGDVSLFAVWSSGLSVVDVEFDELNFDFANVVHVVGTNGKALNNKVLFRNVTTKGGVQVDALVTTQTLSGATITNYESGTGAGGANSYFQVDAAITATNGYAEFKFDFYQHGAAGSAGDPCTTADTNCSAATKVRLKNVNVSAIDIDFLQWNDFTAVESYTVAGNSQSKLKACPTPGSGTCTTNTAPSSYPANMRFQGSGDSNRVNDPVDMAIATYAVIETFKIKFGRSAANNTNYYGVAFKALSWGAQTPASTGGTSYSVTYNGNGANPGNGPTPSTGVVGSNVTLPGSSAFAKTGYTFAGWNTAANGTGTTYAASNVISMPQGGTTLYAKWTANQYMLIYKLYGGVNGPATEMRGTGQVANLSSVVSTRSGVVFSSWNTAADGSGTTYAPGASFTMPGANTTLHAMYSVATGTIAYSANNGSNAPTSTSGTSGTNATAAAAGTMNRANYTFSGWNTAANGTGTDYSAGATVAFPDNGLTTTLYAQWTPVLYSYTFNANGGSGAPANGSAISGATVTIPAATVVRTGYQFAGWTTAADGTGTVYSNGGANPTLTMPGANTVLYAKWTAISYTLTFSSNDVGAGANPAAVTGTYGASVNVAAAPSAPNGKKFNGWNTVQGGTGITYAAGSTLQITADTTLFAQWVDATVNLFYSANGGSGAPSSTTAIANQNTTLSATAATRTGYTFGGWTTAANGSGTIYGASSTFMVPNVDTTLYAKWNPINYLFTYNANGGSGAPATVTYHIGEFVIVDNSGTTVRNGYTFGGWNTEVNGSGSDYLGGQNFLMSNSDVNLFAKWISNPYTLTYSANGGGGAPAAETRNAGSVANLSATAPTRDGYTFNGWNTAINGSGTNYNASASLTMPTSNSTIYAQWVLNSNAVSYNANSGTGAPTGGTFNFAATVTVSSTIPTYVGHTFLGWNTAANGTGTAYAAADTFTMPNSSVVLYARWAAVQKTLTYDANGGAGVVASTSNAFGSTVTVTSTQPTRSGYSFVGWNSMADGSGTTSVASTSFTMPANDVTLYAIWSANAYTVYYNMNGGTGAINPQPGTFGNAVTVSSTAASRTGFTFTGWNTLADGTGSDFTGGGSLTIPASNVTLFAKWTAILYTVSYNANGGANAPADASGVAAGTRSTLSVLTPNQAGFVFNGWNTAANGSGFTYAAGQSFVVPAANTVLYAQWIANEYEIIYNANGGTGAPTAANGTTSSTVTLSATAPTRPGYQFVRWNTDITDVDTNTRYAPGGSFIVPAGNTFLYAIWELADITVTYDINAGTGTTPGSVTDKHLETVTLAPSSAFSRTGYTFNGWNTLANGNGTSYAAESNFVLPEANITLFAQWAQIFYAIEYNPNGGSGAPADQFAPPGQNVSVAVAEPTKSGYDFDSWTLVNQGTTVVPGGSITMPSTNVVLVANWATIASVPGGSSSSPVVTPTPEVTPTPTPTPTPKPTVKPAPKKLNLTVYFKGDSAVLLPLAKIQLKALAAKARAKGPAAKIQVIGRVKETADKSYDLRLSKQRATNVANYLKTLKVKGVWAITAAGISPENKAISRRTDIYINWK